MKNAKRASHATLHRLGTAISEHSRINLIISVLLSSEKENMRLGTMNRIVNPATALLHSNSAPLLLRKQAILRNQLSDVRRQDHMSKKTQQYQTESNAFASR